MLFRQVTLHAGLALALASALLVCLGHRLRWSHWLLSLAAVTGLGTASWALQLSLGGEALPLGFTLGVWLAVGTLVTARFERWNPLAHAAFAATGLAAAAFLAYAVYVVLAAELGPWSLAFALILLALQVAALTLLVAHTFEILDVMCSTHRQRPFGPRTVPGFTPKVSLHVPTHNEPPELVIETLDALARLDYPDYEVLVIDNNTADKKLWRPVEEHCARLGPRFRFFHLMPWPGYKSGALNFALRQTAPDAEIVGVVDADYQVEPNYLKDLVGHFADPQVAFVQTPQDYRDGETRGRYGRALYLAYLYFFRVSMVQRNDRNAIIYAGTMGLIRRTALEQLGGWNEWCITEDAEVSLRLLDAGHESVYIDRTYGRGLMPLDYAGLKKQRFRWAFGGMQILRLHARRLFWPGRENRLTAAQRFAYLSGGLQWLNDPLSLVFAALLLMGAGALVAGGSFYIQPLVGAVMLIPPLFILFAVLRFLWAFRVRSACTWREAGDALTILLGLTWVVSLACARGLVSRQGVFLRTPKKGDQPSLRDAAGIVVWELALGAVCLAAAAAVMFTQPFELLSARGVAVLLLFWQAATFLSGVRSSAWSYLDGRRWAMAPNARSFRTLGHALGRLVRERGTAVWLAVTATLLALLFYVAVIGAPLRERLLRGDPLAQFLPARSLLRLAPEEAAGGILVKEADAARHGDVQRAVALWDPEGVIVDANSTPLNPADDRVWQGFGELQERYREEFRQRRYRRLRHENLRIEVRGDEAEIVNDLFAVVESGQSVRSVTLPGTDRWVLRRHGHEWRIVWLEVNRAPHLPSGKATANQEDARP